MKVVLTQINILAFTIVKEWPLYVGVASIVYINSFR